MDGTGKDQSGGAKEGWPLKRPRIGGKGPFGPREGQRGVAIKPTKGMPRDRQKLGQGKRKRKGCAEEQTEIKFGVGGGKKEGKTGGGGVLVGTKKVCYGGGGGGGGPL